jgi:hypothetical protein
VINKDDKSVFMCAVDDGDCNVNVRDGKLVSAGSVRGDACCRCVLEMCAWRCVLQTQMIVAVIIIINGCKPRVQRHRYL